MKWLKTLTQFSNKTDSSFELNYSSICQRFDLDFKSGEFDLERYAEFLEYTPDNKEHPVYEMIQELDKIIKETVSGFEQKRLNPEIWKKYADGFKQFHYKIVIGEQNYESATIKLPMVQVTFVTENEFIKVIKEPLEKEGYTWVIYDKSF